jgi:hypothetical protein
MDWHTVVCVASGPSLTPSDCAQVAASGLPVVAVNNSWRLIPSCTVIYAADCCWWEQYHGEITNGTERWCGDSFTAERFNLAQLESQLPGNFNSGQRAIELAIYHGARRVLLVGYDCSIRFGAHWHGAHVGLANPDAMSVARWHDEFRQLRDWAVGIEIINCSRRTRLRCFQRQSLEAALSSF